LDLDSRLGALPYDPDPRDYKVGLLTAPLLKEIPDEEVRLLQWVTPSTGRDQGDIGSCVGWDGSFAKDIIRNIMNGEPVHDFSAGFLYERSRFYACVPPSQEGSTNFGLMKALLKEGAAFESWVETDTVRPFNVEIEPQDYFHAFDYAVKSYYRVPTKTVDMQAALLGLTHDPGYNMPDGSVGLCPLITAYPVYDNFKESYGDGYVPKPEFGDGLRGGHSSLIIGWFMKDGKGYWINYNSWGEDVGGEFNDVKGLFFLPFGYPFYDCWVLSMKAKEPCDWWCNLRRWWDMFWSQF